eukprot:TRINITY_DN5199_c2_g2_i2.p1 TRINITY_DN5199_c2_g2~~TRINITY_DN5199_c2_g2_i2.p1  ORF type:complete len:539 (+),score=83.79 TRINITY_DN5199_c2_g2_i2:41-1657(+)
MPVADYDALAKAIKELPAQGEPELMDTEGTEFQLFSECLWQLTEIQAQGMCKADLVVEQYSPLFPELATVLPDPLVYAKVARIMGAKKTIDAGAKAALTQAISAALVDDYSSSEVRAMCAPMVNKVVISRLNSKGRTNPALMHPLMPTFEALELLEGQANTLSEYLNRRLTAYCPRLVKHIGSIAVLKLLLKTKGLRGLHATSPDVVTEWRHILEQSRLYTHKMQATGNPDKEEVLKQVASAVVAHAEHDISNRQPDTQPAKRKLDDSCGGPTPKKQRTAIQQDDLDKLKRRWVPRRKLLQIKATCPLEVLNKKMSGALLRVTVSTTEYQAGLFLRWSSNGQAVVVDFGKGPITVPVTKISNSAFSAYEVNAELLQKQFSEPKTTINRLESEGADWVPESFEATVPVNAPTTETPKAPPAYPVNMLVEARGLVSAATLNGKLGRVRGSVNDRIKVAFLNLPYAEKALKPINLTPVPPEEDPLVAHELPSEYSAYQNASDDCLRKWAARMGLALPAFAETDTIAMMLIEAVGVYPDPTA